MIPTLDYELYCRDLISTTPIRQEGIFCFDGQELGEALHSEYQKLFDFGQGSLNRHKSYSINKGSLFFNPNTTVNAKATRFEDHFIMTINKGTIDRLWQVFYTRKDLFRLPGLEKFEFVQSKSDYPFNKLMFQLCSQFTFYHELGHLIQKSELLKEGISEDVSNRGNYNPERHLLEYDADVFSSISLGTHIYQYIREWCVDLVAGEAELIISGVVSSIFVYLMMFESARIPFYLKESTHPHPFVRLLGIIHAATNSISNIDQQHGVLNLNMGVVLSEFVDCSKVLSGNVFDAETSDIIDGFILNNIQDAGEYNKELIELLRGNEELAVNKRNRVINQ